jgi:hypothetical protein
VSGRLAQLGVPVVLVSLVAGSFQGLPPSRALDAAGLSQPWSVYAPRPVSQRMVLSADVEFADGGRAIWHPPRSGTLLAALSYHWEVWATLVVRDQMSALWEPAAQWIARPARWGGRRVVRVTLQRTWSDLPPPGTSGPAPVSNEFDFYTRDLRRVRR